MRWNAVECPASGRELLRPQRLDRVVGQVTPGRSFEYVFQILNARADPATSRPRLETQVRLWRGREAVYEGAPTVLPVAHAAEQRVVAGGRLNLSSQVPPGDYTLQVVVTDTLAPRAQAVAMQWTNLEAVRAAQDPR
jgi:hypothetical protein